MGNESYHYIENPYVDKIDCMTVQVDVMGNELKYDDNSE